MHSYDRTLLAKLGFSDPDKKNPWHDYACQYLAQPHVLSQIYATFGAQKGWVPTVKGKAGELEYHLTKGQGQYRTTIGFLDLRATGVLKQEFRDRPQSCAPDSSDSSTIAFLTFPSIIEVKVRPVPLGDLIRQVKLYSEYFPWKEHRSSCHFYTKATQAAEVATLTETNFCNAYKACQACKEGSVKWSNFEKRCRADLEEIHNISKKLVATVYPMDSTDVGTLRAEGIQHIQLGPAFETYAIAREASGAECKSSSILV